MISYRKESRRRMQREILMITKADQKLTTGMNSPASRPDAFTLIELLVVISVIGILASLIVGISSSASTSKKLSATEGKLQELITALESYKSDVGSYPPDSKFAGGFVNTVTNQLFYELSGTVLQNGAYRVSAGGEGVSQAACRQFFGTDGFQNVGLRGKDATSYVEFSGSDSASIAQTDNGNVNLLISPVRWPAKALAGVDSRGRALEDYRPIKSNDPALRLLNPYQYRSSGRDRYNQASFDLWVDVPIGDKIYRVNNWAKEPKVISRAD